jgi:small subunit ribosomal protein S6
MPLYEHVYLARQDVTAQQVETLTEQLKQVVEAGGGAISKNEYWGVKTLAYRIKKNRKAHFTLLNITAPAAALAEMERQMRINEDILRFMTVRVDELEEGPSAMLQKRDRDDRDDRGDRGFGGGGRFGGGGGRFGGGGGGGGGRGPRPDRPRRDESAPAEEVL